MTCVKLGWEVRCGVGEVGDVGGEEAGVGEMLSRARFGVGWEEKGGSSISSCCCGVLGGWSWVEKCGRWGAGVLCECACWVEKCGRRGAGVGVCGAAMWMLGTGGARAGVVKCGACVGVLDGAGCGVMAAGVRKLNAGFRRSGMGFAVAGGRVVMNRGV